MANNSPSSKHIFLVVLCILLIIIPVTYADNTDSYMIPQVIKYIKISDDATCFIEENTNYTFKDSSGYVTKTINLDNNQKISNISVITPGLYNDVVIDNSSDKHIIIRVYLYKDKQKTEKVSNQNAKVIYNYNIIKQVNVYDDMAEFKYDTWSRDEGNVLKLETYIYLPDTKDNVRLWNNPPYTYTSTSWVNKTVYEVRYKQLTNDDSAQIRILMPKNYFKGYDNTNIINDNADKIIKQQDDYNNQISFNYTLSYILSAISIILILIPPVLYYKQIRSQKKDDLNQVQSTIPYKSNPAFVNLFVRHNLEYVDINAFYATILDLINKKIININYDEKITIKTADNNNLKEYESSIIEYLGKYVDSNFIIQLDRLLNEDNSQLEGFYKSWQKKVKNEYKSTQCYTNKLSRLLHKISIISFIYLIIVLIYMSVILYPHVPSFDLTFKTLIVLFAVIIVSYYLSIKNKKQPTEKAHVYINRWLFFEKFINDYYLITTYSEDILLNTDDYITYSLALGDMNSFMVNIQRLNNEKNLELNLDLLDYMNHNEIKRFIQIFNQFD